MFSLSAKAITGTGTGATRDEAIENSRRECISLISFDFTSSQIFSTREDGTSEKRSMEITNHQYMTVELIGAETDVQFRNGKYEATTTIPEASSPLYATKAKEALKDISTLKGQVDAKGATAASDDYLVLLNTLKKFEQYRTIVGLLNPEDPVKNLIPEFSTAMIESLYRSSLEKEMNGLELTVQDLEQQARLGILEAEGRRRLEEARKSLEETRKKQEEQRLRRQEEISLRMTALEEIVKMSLEDLPAYSSEETETDSVTSLINSIEADRSAFGKYMETVKHELGSIKNQYETSVREVSEQFDRQPLGTRTERGGVVYYNNIPEALALEQRNLEKQDIIREMENNCRVNATQIYNSRFPTLKEIRTHAGDLLSKLVSRTFTFSTDNDGITAYIKDADYENCNYIGTCNLTVGGKVVSMDFIIPAEEFVITELSDQNVIALVNKLADGTMDYETFKKNRGVLDYINAFQNWYSLLSVYPELFAVSMNVRVSTDGSPSYTLVIDSYSVYRNGKDGRTSIYTNETDTSFRTRYVNHSDFSYETGFENTLLDMDAVLRDDSTLIPVKKGVTETKNVTSEKEDHSIPAESSTWTVTSVKDDGGKKDNEEGQGPARTPIRDYDVFGVGFSAFLQDSSLHPETKTAGMTFSLIGRITDCWYQQADFSLLFRNTRTKKTNYSGDTVTSNAVYPGIGISYLLGFSYPSTGMVRFHSAFGMNTSLVSIPSSKKTLYSLGTLCTAGVMFCLSDTQDGYVLPGDTGVVFRLYGMMGTDLTDGFTKGIGASISIGII